MKKETLFEAIGDIDESYVTEAHTAKATPKASAWIKWIAIAAGLAVAIGLPFIANTFPPNYENKLVVNQAEGFEYGDIDARYFYYNDLSAVEKEDFLLTFQNTTGVSYQEFTARLPDTLTITSFYSMHLRQRAPNSGYAFHSYILDCRTDNWGEVTIAFSPTSTPLRCCLIYTETPVLSQINGFDVEIHGMSNFYSVQFRHKGLYYDIETSGIALEELEELLSYLLCS